MGLICVVGRGHSGTRVISHTLMASGVHMGGTVNESGDLVPPDALYSACRLFGRHVRWDGNIAWRFDEALAAEPPQEFVDLVHEYLDSVLTSTSPRRGWKLPETTLILPWIVRLFPDARFVHWVRNPRDSIVNRHVTDSLWWFGVPCGRPGDVRLRRALSWKYHHDIVAATPAPANWHRVRLEDFVLDQRTTLDSLEAYLGLELATAVVRPDAVDRWRTDPGVTWFDFFEPAMRELGYESSIPARAVS